MTDDDASRETVTGLVVADGPRGVVLRVSDTGVRLVLACDLLDWSPIDTTPAYCR